jgi:hypothetical protein
MLAKTEKVRLFLSGLNDIFLTKAVYSHTVKNSPESSTVKMSH